jgi:hypothetical protein
MRIEIEDPTVLPDLLEYLRAHAHVVADRVGPRELEVSLLGSRNSSARRLELELLVQAWHAARGRATRVTPLD